MAGKTLIYKSVSVFLIALFIWTFLIFMPRQEIKELGIEMGMTKAYAGTFMPADPGSPVPPLPTDLSEPTPDIKYSWARVAGRTEAVYLNIPSNQLTNRIMLPSDPSPLILGKYDPSTRSGTIAVMRMRMIGPNIQAEIVRLTPGDFKTHLGPSLYNFAFLDWNSNDSNCDWSQKYLRGDDPPDINNDDIQSKFLEWDLGRTFVPPTLITGIAQPKINRSNYYWHQRLNNDPCFTHYGLKDFDTGDGNFHNMSETGFLKMAALAMGVHKAAVIVIAEPQIRQAVNTETHKSFFTKTVKTTVSYYLKPKWMVGTPVISGTYSEFIVNPTYDNNGNVSIVSVQGNHTFPVDETLIYQWSQSQSGWTGLFVFVAVVVVFALAGGVGGFLLGEPLAGVFAGAAVGGIGGLAASGFSPTTDSVADITPFYDSSYSLDTSGNYSGDAAEVAKRTFAAWLSPDIMNTPGGVQVFATNIDIRKALACGGASHATVDCTTPAITQIGMDDPRFNSVYTEMFSFPNKELQKYKYPFTTR